MGPGTSSVSMEVDSKAELKDLLRKGSMELMGSLRPSAALQVAGAFVIDVRGSKTGARAVTTLHSATNVKASLTMKVPISHLLSANSSLTLGDWEQDGKSMISRLELPSDKLEILNVDSVLLSVSGNVETPEAGVPGPKSDAPPYCSPPQLNKITGLKVLFASSLELEAGCSSWM